MSAPGPIFSGIALAVTLAVVGSSHAQGDDIALERNVFDADRGVRATITYRTDALTGGSEEIVNSDGSVSTLYWDGYVGQFTAEITEGGLSGADVEAFLREAVVAVCPSVDREGLAGQWIQVEGPFLRIFAQCPEVDARQ